MIVIFKRFVLFNLRTKLHYTQKQLAKLAGISASSIQKYELGERTPSKETAQKLVNALNVPLNYIYSTDFNDLINKDLPPDIVEVPDIIVKLNKEEYISGNIDNNKKETGITSCVDFNPQKLYYENKYNPFYKEINPGLVNIISTFNLDTCATSDTKYLLSNVFDIDLGNLTDDEALEIKSYLRLCIKVKQEEMHKKKGR